jgi:hypothetical protein
MRRDIDDRAGRDMALAAPQQTHREGMPRENCAVAYTSEFRVAGCTGLCRNGWLAGIGTTFAVGARSAA